MSWLISKDKYWSFIQTPSSKWREKGNSHFKSQQFDKAIEDYSVALILADNTTERPSLLSNRSAAYLEIGLFQQALDDAARSIYIDKNWWRGYLRKACAYACLGEVQKALETLQAGFEATGHSTLQQKLKETKSNISELLITQPGAEPIVIQSPAIGGALRLISKRAKTCAQLFQNVEQGNVISIRSMFEAAKASGYWSALTAVDSNTGQTALHMAALNPSSSSDQLEIIWLLLRAGVRPEALDKLGYSALTMAAISGNTIGMSVILEHMLTQPLGPVNTQAFLTSCDEVTNFDVLCHAVLADRKEPVLALLGDYEYCHIQETTYGAAKRNILHLAAINGSTNALEALIKLCFEDVQELVVTPDRAGFMPLAYAAANCTRRHMRGGQLPRCFEGSVLSVPDTLEVPIKGLLSRGGANVAFANELDGESKSWSTIVCDSRCTTDSLTCPHAEFVNTLLETGVVDVNQLNGPTDGVSALFLASLYGHVPVVRMLLHNGAKQDVGSLSPLQAATATNNRVVMDILLTYNSNNLKNFMLDRPPCLNPMPGLHDSPLTIALANCAELDHIKTLLLHLPPHMFTGEDLQLSLISKQLDLVKTLLKAGMRPNTANELYGELNGLATAVDTDDLILLRAILDHSAITTEVDWQGRNILHHVCEMGKSDALLLIFEELDTHFPNETQRKNELRKLLRPLSNSSTGRSLSPLELAARNDSSPCYKILQSSLQEAGFTKADLIGLALPQNASATATSQLNTSTTSHQHNHAGSTQPHSHEGHNHKPKGKKGSSKSARAAAAAGASGGQHSPVLASFKVSSDQMLSALQPAGLDKLKRAVRDKLADFAYQQASLKDITISDLPAINDETLKIKLAGLLEWMRQVPDPMPYFKVLHSTQQTKRVSNLLCELNIVQICLTESLKTNNALYMQQWLRTFALLHRNDTPFLDDRVLGLIISLLGNTLFMDTPKAQAYLMVTINNECAAHPKVSPLIVSKLSEKENKTPLLRFFDCCIKTVQDDEASPAGIGLLDLFTHVFLKEESFTDTYSRVIGALATSPPALGALVASINNVTTKAIDLSASLRMIQRVSQYFPAKVILAGAVLPLLRICSTRAQTDHATLAVTVSAYGAFSDLLKFTNLPLQRLLWKVMSHAMYIEIGLESPYIEARTAACDAVVCLCRDARTQHELVSDPRYFDLILKCFVALIPSSKPLSPSQLTEVEALALRECILALSFLWNKDPTRVQAVLSVSHGFDVLLALYHLDGISAVVNRIIQIVWAYAPEKCQALVSESSLTLRLYQAFTEKSGWSPTPSNLALLKNVEPFAVPKWHSPADGVQHEDIEGVSCAYCGVGEKLKPLRDYSPNGSAQYRYCSLECAYADVLPAD